MNTFSLIDESRVPDELKRLAAARTGFADEYPFESHWASADGHCMHYIDEGSGPPLLMVHGNPTWSFAWRHLVRSLSSDYRVIAVDHLGCGFSSSPQADLYTLEGHISRLQGLIQALDLRDIGLFAHDWGGAIGMGAAVRMPDRFGRFVLMNTAAFRSTRIPLRISLCRIPGLGPLGVRGFNLFVRAALVMATAKGLSEEAKAGLAAPYRSWAERIAVSEFVQDIPLRESHRSYRTLKEVEEGLSQFAEHPMCLIWGMRDWCFTPEFLDEFCRRFPQAQAHRIPDAGHYVFEDACEQVIETAGRFLSSSKRG